jgi:hypothetical protein
VSIDHITNGTIKTATTASASKGTSTFTFPVISNLLRWSIGEYSIGANSYYFEATNVTSTATATTVTVEVYDPATNSFVTAGFATNVPAGTTVYFNLDGETTQDICIAAAAAPGAKVAVYFTSDTEAGWVDLITRAIHPNPEDFPAGVNPPSVLSASWIIGADDPKGLTAFGISASVVQAMDAAFQDAALQGVTVCIASGDAGTWGQVSDGYAHAYYPASDPWILSVGGTTVGQYQLTGPSTRAWVEFLWNDTFFGGTTGATGGGVSDFFPVPSYQNNAGVPNSINKTINSVAPFNSTGRGYPDVAANASPNSGYPMFVGGGYDDANGTSASAPLWAALIAILNSNLGFNVGFLNTSLYSLGSSVFNPISPLWPKPDVSQLAKCPTDNGMNGILGYKAGGGWDACTGWGSPNGTELLNALRTWGVQFPPALWHTIRNANGSWQAAFGLIAGQSPGGPCPGFVAEACGSADGQALQVVGVGTDGKLWHTIRYPNGGWQSSMGLIESQSSGGPAGFKDVGCAGAGGGLHVVGLGNDGKLWHTIRNANGGWQSSFGLIESQSSGGPASFVAVACGSADGHALQVVGVGSDGRLWHTIRNPNGSWQSGFGLIESQSAGGPRSFKGVGCAGAGGGLHVVGVGPTG